MKSFSCLLVVLAVASACRSSAPARKPLPVKPKTVVEFRIARDEPGHDTVAMPLAGKDPTTYYVDPKAFLDGTYVKRASAAQNEFGMHLVSVWFNDEGAAIMGKATGENIGKHIAIIVNGKLISVPIIRGKLSVSGQITGNFTKAEAERIANDLNASP